jgi:hypothetical protein
MKYFIGSFAIWFPRDFSTILPLIDIPGKYQDIFLIRKPAAPVFGVD